jgi:hypothetical protein
MKWQKTAQVLDETREEELQLEMYFYCILLYVYTYTYIQLYEVKIWQKMVVS